MLTNNLITLNQFPKLCIFALGIYKSNFQASCSWYIYLFSSFFFKVFRWAEIEGRNWSKLNKEILTTYSEEKGYRKAEDTDPKTLMKSWYYLG